MRPWRPARVSASSWLTRSTVVKKRPRRPARMQLRAMAISAYEHDVALLGDEAAAGEIANERLVDRRVLEGEVVEILGERQLRGRDLILDRPRLLLRDLGAQEVAVEALRLVLALERGRERLVVGGLHAVELQFAHHVEDFGSLHRQALLKVS